MARTDFLWEETGVVGEADGLEKYDGVNGLALRQEKLRQETLEQTGLIVVRWGWSDLADLPRLVDRIGRALVRGSRRPATEKFWFVDAA